MREQEIAKARKACARQDCSFIICTDVYYLQIIAKDFEVHGPADAGRTDVSDDERNLRVQVLGKKSRKFFGD
jgi:hypothetical protein